MDDDQVMSAQIQPSALVTGADGFIGRHLGRTLELEGWTVLRPEVDIRALAGFRTGVDAVFHLAALTTDEAFQKSVAEAFDVNVAGTQAVLNYGLKHGAKVVLISTSGVYGEPTGGGMVSEDHETAPVRLYGVSKLLMEKLGRRAVEDLGARVTILRLFNVYGPGQRPPYVIPYLLERLLAEEVISLRMPHAVRDFIHVSDVVRAMILAARKDEDDLAVYNIGTGQATRILDLVQAMAAAFGRQARIDTVGPQAGEVPGMIADPTRARNLLGWEARVALREGLLNLRVVGPDSSPDSPWTQ